MSTPPLNAPDAPSDRPTVGAPILRTKDLKKIYQGDGVAVHALRGVDLEIASGELIVLLGASGSGKSTLLNILGGLDSPTEGDVWFGAERLSGFDHRGLTRYRRRHVGFIFQFYNLMPGLTARENVELATDLVDDPIPAEEALAMVGLGERVDHFPAELSGGEQQRVAVARAVAKRPELLFCDEPTGALDSATGVRVLETLDEVNRRYGATTLIITHNAGIAEMADRVIYFADGAISRIEEVGRRRTPRELSW